MDLTISKAENLDDQRILALYQEFHESMPLNVMFGLDGRPRNTQPKYSPEDFIIIAEDLDGNIVGFAANKVNATFTSEPDPSPQRIELEKFLEFVEHSAGLERLPQRWIELRVLSVTEAWRGRGVGRRLVEASVAAARAAGFRALTMCCVSEFTAKLARSLGWKEHYRLAYSDYPRLSGRDIQLRLNPPHDNVYIYYTEL